MIEKTELEKLQGTKDVWEKRIYLDGNVLIVGYTEEEASDKPDAEEEIVKNYYWYWELRNSQNWDLLFDNREKNFNFCESQIGTYDDQDSIEDVVGDIDEREICKWSEKDWIKDISENIADEVLEWLTSLSRK